MAAGERTIRIRFDGSVAGLTRAVKVARAQLSGLEKRVDTMRKTTAGFTSGVGRAVSAVAKFAVVLAALAGGLNLVGSLGAAIGAMSGALGLLPAAGFAAAGALAAVKLGADGITAAFERLTPTIDAMRSAVSATFERTLAPAVDNLRQLLPQLTGGLQGVAAAMGGVAERFTDMLNTGMRTKQLQNILADTSTTIANLGRFLAPVGAAFITIGEVGGEVLAELTAGAAAVGERFNRFVTQAAADGRLREWIEAGIEAFRQLGAIIGDISAIVRAVFTALNDAGIGLGGTLGVITGQIREFVESADGQKVLQALAEAVATVGNAVSRVLGAALDAIGPILPDLLDAFGQLASQLGSVLASAIDTVGPLLAGLATFLAENMAWLGPLAIAIGGVAVAIQGVVAAVRVWRAVVLAMTIAQWALNAALAANPIGLVIVAVAALVAGIVWLWNKSAAFRNFFIGVWNVIRGAVGAVVSWFRNAWNNAVAAVRSFFSRLRSFASGVWNGIRSGVSGVVNFFRNAWNNAVNGVRGFFSGLGRFASGVWDGIVSGLKSALNVAIRVLNGLISAANVIPGVSIPSIPYLAKGGTAQAGRSYLVGENGPELFTPGRTGRVTNANTTAEAIGGGGGPSVLELHLDLGEGIRQVVNINLERHDGRLRRRVAAGVGSAA